MRNGVLLTLLLCTTLACADDYSAYGPPEKAKLPNRALEGRLVLDFSALEIRDAGSMAWTREYHDALPVVDFQVVSDGSAVIPDRRGLNVTASQVWDYVIGVGTSWREGETDVASLPITWIYRVVNCAHNGAIRVSYRDTELIEARLLVGQETCHFKRADISGIGKGRYQAGPVPAADDLRNSYRMEMAGRIPVRPWSEFAGKFPEAAALFEAGLPTDDDLTTLGVYFDGRHYNRGCGTRFGDYPFCSEMLMTSFSTAKTAYAGLALMVMAEEFGPEVYEARVLDLLPEAKSAAGDWRNVTLDHMNDMANGNFAVRSPMADADPGGFYDDSDRAGKLAAAFKGPAADKPGAVFVYQTADTFIQVAALDAYLAKHSKSHSDSFEYLVDRVFQPLGIQPDVWFSRRTTEQGVPNSGTAFGGMGMFWTIDAAVKFGRFFQGDGTIDGRQVAHRAALDAAMQRDPGDRGIDTEFFDSLYNNNTWAISLKPFGDAYQCDPYVVWMSGLSGVRINMMPNGMVTYYFNDAQAFPLREPIAAAQLVAPFCGEG